MSISPVEYSILPKDTYITRKLYKNAVTGDGLFVALVMSGADRSSIHRPQLCLVGQGNEILGQHVEEVPMTGRDDLGVMVIDMMRPYARNSKQQGKYPSFYAYWFVGKDRETPYHVERMFWMAYDRIVKNVSHRWSYISISGSGKYAAKKETVDAFVADFYPQITRDPKLMSHE
ncbi:MAG: exosortase-associated EpsI family protein [Spartobacteria bacterium]|nr:exosortase-associated EpsI family protein [Spartobacteria bacterium]